MSTLMHAPVLTGLFSSRPANNRRSFVLLEDPLPPNATPQQPQQSQSNTENNTPQEPRLRGIIGYHNAFYDGSADYDFDETENLVSRGLNQLRRPLNELDGSEPLPEYDCTILKHGPVSVKIERRSPFDFVQQPQWFEAYVVLCGTMLNVHHVKQAGIRPSRADRILDMAGKLIKSYTLQHAEAGLAADHKKVEMVPKNPVTSLLPETAIEHLKATEPHLFEQKNIYVLRLRLETDQILLRFRSSEARASWLLNICAAIDLAPEIDRRTEPRFQTLPRRSRRRREANVQLNAAMVEQQERIMREQFPNLAAAQNDGSGAFHGASSDARDADAEDLDNSLVAVTQSTAIPRRRAPGRMLNTMSRFFENRLSQHFSSDLNVLQLAAADPAAVAPTEEEDFAQDPDEKWNPGTIVDPVREARCIRRCMPTLLFNSRRANKLILKDGVLMVIDWKKKAMSPYTGQPPTYEESQAEAEPETPDTTETPGFVDLFRQATEQDENNNSPAATPQPTVSIPTVRARSRSRRRPSLRPRTAGRTATETDDSATSGSSGDDAPEPTSRKAGWFSRLRKVSSKPNLKSRPSEPIKQHPPAPVPIDIQQHQYIHSLKRRQERPMSTYEIGDDAALRRMGLI